ncbi:MAG: peptidoglycan bridge formation glycyltransferase FemA/FemB family protein [Candidatus Spechtbacterales bacterium]
MSIREIRDKTTWDDFITAQKDHTFLHSWAWGKLNEAEGDKIWHLGFYDDNRLVVVALVIKVHARRGNFLFVPQGPIFDKNWANPKSEYRNTKQIQNHKFQILDKLTNHLKQLAQEEGGVAFIRISPLLEESEENKKMFRDLGFRNAPIYMHAETAWQLDITKNEDELMMGMRKNTRNLVRRAQKDGVEIFSGVNDEFIEEFFKLYKQTAGKHGFTPFSKNYIKEEIKAFEGSAKIYLAKYKGKTLSTAVIVQQGTGAFYHHGASSPDDTKIPAAYLLQWQAILDAKQNGRTRYNFWGIAKNEDDKKHPWHGLTFFKKGFGGYRTDYMHAQDLPLSPKYWLNYLIEKVRLLKRGV